MQTMRLLEFDFENLEVYQRSLDFADGLFALSETFPAAVDRTLGDQLRRAGLSIANNLAEGSNKVTAKGRMQFYGYALDSARECVPMLSLCVRRGLLTDQEHAALREACLTICRMLRGLIRSAGNR